MPNETRASFSKDETAILDLIEEAEKIITANRRLNTRTENRNDDGALRELQNIRYELDNFLAPQDDITNIPQPDSSISSVGMPISTDSNSYSVASEHSIENDDDVLLISDTSNSYIPVVDLCTPVNDNRPTRRRRINSDDIIEIDDYTPINNRRIKLQPPSNPNTSVISPIHKYDNEHNTNVIMCPICLESTVNRQPKSTKCGHVYCADCIKNSLQISKKCPICKRQCSVKQLISLYL